MSVRHPEVTTTCDEVRDLLERLGDRWSIYVLYEVADAPRRFRGLQRAIPGISQRMLTLTLRRLEEQGLITRTVYATIPPQVEYEMSDLGRSLGTAVLGLVTWLRENGEPLERARERFARAHGG
ncbi:winged helix-turn-helix transcriptional regulator [Sphaerisporangium dianthi]|uniref:Winged helix-turn-helix transcriptional regulator n=1 Tax=Sphaerisporangium dianthi TaxID=1436120 RepID=A0ABV9CNL1_9ACTN